MSRSLKVGWALLTALTVVITAAFHQASAQEVEVGHGLICNTPDEVRAFVAAHNGDNQAALQKVNAKENVCGILNVAYVRGKTIARIQTKDGPADIVSIEVVGINLGMGWMQGEPLPQFTLFLIREREA